MNTGPTINPGDVVEIFEQKRLMTAVCVGYKNSRLNLVTETSRLLTLSHSRVIHCTPSRLNPGDPRKTLIGKTRDISAIRNRIADSLDPETLWHRVHEKGQTLSLTRLSDYLTDTGTASDDRDREAGLLRAVHRDKCYFKNTDLSVYVFSEEEVTQNIERLKDQKLEEDLIQALSDWLERNIRTPERRDPPPDGYKRLVDALIADVTQTPVEQKDKMLLASVMNRISPGSPLSHFDILVLLGEFEPDENLDFIRFRYPVTFSDDAHREVMFLRDRPVVRTPERRDLTGCFSFTIDSRQTRDFDDALTFQQTGGAYEIGIHITDITCWTRPGSALDEEARERGQTLYLPPKTWHMFPEMFSENIASLQEGIDRPVLSVMVTIRPDASIEAVHFIPSIIRVSKRYTYDDVDALIGTVPFADLLQLSQALQERRVHAGAILMPRPEITIDATAANQIVIHRRNRQSPSQQIVSELMILANTLVAEKAAQSGIPFPFRCQAKPEEPAPRSNHTFNPYISYCQRRVMPRADSSLKPEPHYTLALHSYTNITSPIRRYFDVLAQRQFLAVLDLDKPYSYEELTVLMSDLEQAVARASTIAWHQHRYWLYKYLEGSRGQILDAVVMDRIANGYQIFIQDLCLDAFLPLSFSHKLYPEQTIRVILERVSARESILKLRLQE